MFAQVARQSHIISFLLLGECTEHDVRLVGGSDEGQGRVEVCLFERWGTVCDHRWTTQHAEVVCRQLGLSELGQLYEEIEIIFCKLFSIEHNFTSITQPNICYSRVNMLLDYMYMYYELFIGKKININFISNIIINICYRLFSSQHVTCYLITCNMNR